MEQYTKVELWGKVQELQQQLEEAKQQLILKTKQ